MKRYINQKPEVRSQKSEAAVKSILASEDVSGLYGIQKLDSKKLTQLPLPASHVNGWSALVFRTPTGERVVRLRKRGMTVWTPLTARGNKTVASWLASNLCRLTSDL